MDFYYNPANPIYWAIYNNNYYDDSVSSSVYSSVSSHFHIPNIPSFIDCFHVVFTQPIYLLIPIAIICFVFHFIKSRVM